MHAGVYPHQQDTGGFFITVLEKTSLKPSAKPEQNNNAIPKASSQPHAELDAKKNERLTESLWRGLRHWMNLLDS